MPLAPANNDGDEIPMSLLDTTAYFACSMLTLIIGALGNLLLMGTVLAFKKLRSVNNIFIFNLVLADSVCLVLLDVFSVIGIAYEGSGLLNYGSRFCKVISYFALSATLCSVWSLASCALHIYIRVCHKNFYRAIYTVHSVTVMVFWIWTLCPMIVLPSMMGWGSHAYDSRLMHCSYDFTASSSFTFFLLALGWWLPFLVVAFCIVRTLAVLRAQNFEIQPGHVTPMNTVMKENNDLPDAEASCSYQVDPDEFRMPRPIAPPTPCINDLKTIRDTLFAVMAVSLCLIIGSGTMSIIWFLDKEKHWEATEFAFAMLVAHSPASINGIIYALVNKHFRSAYVSIIMSVRRCRRSEDGSEVNIDSSAPGSQETRRPPSGQENLVAVNVPELPSSCSELNIK